MKGFNTLQKALSRIEGNPQNNLSEDEMKKAIVEKMAESCFDDNNTSSLFSNTMPN